MKTLVRIGALSCFIFTSVLLIGCGGGGGSLPTTSIPAAEGGGFSSDIIRVGDKITIQLSGVPDGGFYVEKQIPPSGDYTLPLLTQTFVAVGKTTSQVSEEVTDAYKAQKIYTNPVVSVLAEERYITIGDDAKIGANAVVLCDVPPGATAVGVPARIDAESRGSELSGAR